VGASRRGGVPTIVDGDYVAALLRAMRLFGRTTRAAYAKDTLQAPSASAMRRKSCATKIPRISSRTGRIEKISGATGLDPHRETIVYGSRGTWIPISVFTLCSISAAGKSASTHDGMKTGPPRAGDQP